jgi:hypothetical protein
VSPGFEGFLARIYADAEARRLFLADPDGEATRAGLAPEEAEALAAIDRTGLELAARSYERKREAKAPARRSFWRAP